MNQRMFWSLSVLALPLATAIASCNRLSLPSTFTADAQSSELPVVSEAKVQQTTVVDGLEHPWGMAWLPDGDVLITERPGRLKRLRTGKGTLEAIAGIPPVFASGQGGLLDVAVHPDFSETPWLYFSYSAGDNSANRTQVSRAKFKNNQLSNWQVIFQVNRTKSGTQHFGSRLAWLPDNTLLISIGDGGNPPVKLDGDVIRKQAQNRATHFGSVVRIRDDGTVPEDNPFVAEANTGEEIASELWTYGHRNIQGLAVDSATGQVWATEHGSRGGDELNVLSPRSNYGWPEVSYSKEYTSPRMVAPVTTRADVPEPLIEWTPSIAPSGLAVYRGDVFPEWDGHLFAGALVNREVRRIVVEDGQAKEVEAIALGQRVRDVQQGPDGFLYVLTDDANGRLVRLEPASVQAR